MSTSLSDIKTSTEQIIIDVQARLPVNFRQKKPRYFLYQVTWFFINFSVIHPVGLNRHFSQFSAD